MPPYRHILFATDLSAMTEAAAMRAAALTRRFRAQLTLLHVIEHFPVDASNDPIPPENADPAEFLATDARNRLRQLVQQIGRPRSRQMVIRSAGPATRVIVEVAQEIRADLIVLASSGHDRAPHLLRSTPCAVLNDAPCDVLAVLLTGVSEASTGATPKRLSRTTRRRRR